jgi:hypothetical protein
MEIEIEMDPRLRKDDGRFFLLLFSGLRQLACHTRGLPARGLPAAQRLPLNSGLRQLACHNRGLLAAGLPAAQRLPLNSGLR